MRTTEPGTLLEALERAARFPEAGLRLLDRREQAEWLGWSAVLEEAQKVAEGLHTLGIRKGDCVALVYPTEKDFFSAFFGALMAGAVPVPLYPPVRLGRLEEYHARTSSLLRAVESRVVLASPRVRKILGRAIADADPDLGCLVLEELQQARVSLPAAGSDDLALVQFSSGTTVDPKPVALTHRAVMAQVKSLNAFWPDSPEVRQTGASWLPLYHDMGLIGCVLPALERPSELTLIPPELFVARPSVWLRAISRYRATVSPAPNFAYGLCVEKIRDEEMEGIDLSCWRVALNGAEPVAPSALRAFAERFSKWGFEPRALTPVYGLSEAALAVTFSSIERHFQSQSFDRRALAEEGVAMSDPAGMELVSVGQPLPGFQISVRDPSGRERGEAHVGRIWVRGPSLMKGYLNRPDITAEALREGWLDTGDLGFCLQGELYITGRAKDALIVRGQNHDPAEIERALWALPAVRTGCAAAVSHRPDTGEAEEIWLFVERSRSACPDGEREIERACKQEILKATAVAVDRVVVLQPGTLPRTSSGKVRRAEALRQYLASELVPPKEVSVPWLAKSWLESWWALLRWRLRRRGGWQSS
jgi:fatty-acyl-CoA synthase